MGLAVTLAGMGVPAETARELEAALAADAGTVDISTLEIDGTEVTASAAELNYNDITTLGTVQASKTVTADSNKDVTGFRNVTLTGTLVVPGTLTQGSDTTDRVAVKGIYMSPANVVVAVPTIANDAAENIDEVAVDVSGAFSMAPAVGDAVIAIPQEALPTDCVFLGAWVSATDQITVSFGTKEGGGGVTGANKNFKFLVFDLT
jgi:hypothetical protein